MIAEPSSQTMDIDDISELHEGQEILRQLRESKREAAKHVIKRKPTPAERKEAVRLHELRGLASTLAPASVTTTYLPPPYYPCVKPLADLKKAFIKDVRFEKPHEGKYILVRAADKQRWVPAISTIAQDEKGDQCVLQLWYYDKTGSDKEIGMPQGSILIIKEPYLKRTSDTTFEIRVYHPTDVVFLSDDDDQLPFSWKGDPKWNTFLAWKTKGDRHSEGSQHRLAIECYTRALDRAPTSGDTELVTLARCHAFIGAKQFDAALLDLGPLTSSTTATANSTPTNALLLKAEALYGLQHYKESCEFIAPLCKQKPPNPEALAWYKRSINRIMEQKSGKYDFKAMMRDVVVNNPLSPPILDNASYSVPVEVRPTPSHGKGLVTTKTVKAGDLLFCEKAFTYAFQGSTTDRLVDADKGMVTKGTQMDLLAQTVYKVHHNPSLLPIITALDHGSYKPVKATSVNGNPIIDAFLIKKIIDLNAFGCPRSTSSQRLAPTATADYSSGIWPLAARINHSCNGNARRSFIGDMMIVRATRDLNANTEITWSYRQPGMNNYEERQAGLKRWEFTCDCVICEDEKATDADQFRTRKGKAKEFLGYMENIREQGAGSGDRVDDNEIVRYLDAMKKTYNRPATEVPRVDLWNTIMGILVVPASLHVKQTLVIDSAQDLMLNVEALKALGHGIEVNPAKGEIFVRQWGLMLDGVLERWEAILFELGKKSDLFECAKSCAKVAYRMKNGQDETFEELLSDLERIYA